MVADSDLVVKALEHSLGELLELRASVRSCANLPRPTIGLVRTVCYLLADDAYSSRFPVLTERCCQILRRSWSVVEDPEERGDIIDCLNKLVERMGGENGTLYTLLRLYTKWVKDWQPSRLDTLVSLIVDQNSINVHRAGAELLDQILHRSTHGHLLQDRLEWEVLGRSYIFGRWLEQIKSSRDLHCLRMFDRSITLMNHLNFCCLELGVTKKQLVRINPDAGISSQSLAGPIPVKTKSMKSIHWVKEHSTAVL